MRLVAYPKTRKRKRITHNALACIIVVVRWAASGTCSKVHCCSCVQASIRSWCISSRSGQAHNKYCKTLRRKNASIGAIGDWAGLVGECFVYYTIQQYTLNNHFVYAHLWFMISFGFVISHIWSGVKMYGRLHHICMLSHQVRRNCHNRNYVRNALRYNWLICYYCAMFADKTHFRRTDDGFH